MKIILHKEVDKLGAPGDVVDVADGYARNFLIPRGLAAPASKGAIRHADRLRQAHEKRTRADLEAAQAIAERLSVASLRVPAKAGEDGRLFGSITVHHLAEEIEKLVGVPIDRRNLVAEPIRSTGTHEVTVHLHPDVNATVTVEVVAQ
ncbi:MAG TPA: 50S ribosomal protein L9 [Actinomycetota bacterium]|jgi:large subunit ribosomal protein L9|nr:50S ribosomal protein L9 [Actinomycetota bacterium]